MSTPGVVNVYKEKGYTSSDVVSIVRKLLNSKAGHVGTLDPQATGVLPVCIGSATKTSDYISGNKRYRAELKLGVTTDTDDLTGKVLTESPVEACLEELKAAVQGFLGETQQIPPMYSAIKIGGKKLYELARAGKTVERAPRIVNISQIDVLEYNHDTCTAVIDVSCSKGTYIRSLCADIGRVLNCGGCMGELIRTQSGPFHITDSIKLERLKDYVNENRISDILIRTEDILPYQIVDVPLYLEKRIINGNPVSVDKCEARSDIQEGELAFLRLSGKISGLYVRDGEDFVLRVMLG